MSTGTHRLTLVDAEWKSFYRAFEDLEIEKKEEIGEKI